ncbi:MAG: fumarylacetoacetase [Microscillaceae bacterium]|nr:fumarylacetoacetase [Microscillaceae bacterium]MDW8461178.1 fumarylacetoacetase [Cytophagales bacterium]
MIPANHPQLRSWIEVPQNHDFPIQNLPFGIFSTRGNPNNKRVGVAIGDYVLDLSAVAEHGFFNDLVELTDLSVFYESYLNPFIALGQSAWRATRQRISELLQHDNPTIRDNADLQKELLFAQKEVQMHLPVQIGDYTDFYSSLEHATNVGSMFRPDNPLFPNWKHLPVAYHGRASSIVVSGTPIRRPKGQSKPDYSEQPIFGASRSVDFELEVAFVIGKSTELGQSISVQEAENHIFGLLLFNDWSARDIQKWEYMPLGPFLGKNFASSVSPWIVTLDALEPFRTASPKQEPKVLPYLQFEGDKAFDIQLEVWVRAESGAEKLVCQSNFKYLYWNMAQQLAHHTVNGCNVNIGDLCASGTISGKEPNSFGSLLELTWGGKNPILMPDGSELRFLRDGDTVIMRGYAQKNGLRIGFGEVANQLLPAL